MTKLLLVEDNELNRDMLARRLTRSGYQVLLAIDGCEGVDMAQAESPDLILMDLSLPTLDGWEATRQLKVMPSTCSIPVIALTAHAMSGDRDKALDAGCDDYDIKPIDFPRLLDKIQACLTSVTQHVAEAMPSAHFFVPSACSQMTAWPRWHGASCP